MARDGVASVSVCDNGPGLAPEMMTNLFDAFFTSKPGRSGLGLSISRTIVEAHSGKLTAPNNPDGGATFHFTIPLAKGRRLKPF
ncbi:hypothetical protein GRI65_09010 [Altererythrobacter sediminis]|uniref:histidine kinase n=2 Tax=Allopontixanthobacter sediminis TaxID=1689985 RepID=A0A845B373_9SPHN|nr:hypothetical protein [Allopontixanthobacter sediminis]